MFIIFNQLRPLSVKRQKRLVDTCRCLFHSDWFPSFFCLYLVCLRSAGGFYQAGRAEGSPVMWHRAENPLPDVPRRAAHAQAEASDHSQRPQGSLLLGWLMNDGELVNDLSESWWMIKQLKFELPQDQIRHLNATRYCNLIHYNWKPFNFWTIRKTNW